MPILNLLIQVVLGFVVIGVVMWLINTYVPMQPRFKDIMNTAVVVIVVVALIVWILQTVVPGFHFGSVR